MSNAIEFTDAGFEQEVIKSEIPVMVDFWASWCGPCMMLAPLVDKIAKEYEGKIKVGKVDVDANPNISSTLGVRSIPTLMFFKKGELKEQIIGVVAEAQLKKVIEKVLNS